MAFEFTEFTERGPSQTKIRNVLHGGQLATQEVAIGGTSVQSDPFDADTRLIVCKATADCRIAIGADPTAARVAPKTFLMYASIDYEFEVAGGDLIAVIQA
jgi:hypothetical protein